MVSVLEVDSEILMCIRRSTSAATAPFRSQSGPWSVPPTEIRSAGQLRVVTVMSGWDPMPVNDIW
jgi:hypothetical protein